MEIIILVQIQIIMLMKMMIGIRINILDLVIIIPDGIRIGHGIMDVLIRLIGIHGIGVLFIILTMVTIHIIGIIGIIIRDTLITRHQADTAMQIVLMQHGIPVIRGVETLAVIMVQ
jgi:hypothetical protein